MLDSLLDALMPSADVCARYTMIVHAPVERVYRICRTLSIHNTAVALWLLRLRALPAQFDSCASSETPDSFILLGERSPREVVFGFAGRFWHPSRNITPLPDAESWCGYVEEGSAKAAFNIAFEPMGDRQTRLSTETRIVCYGRAARLKFKAYWFVMGWFSGLIRKAWLAEVRRRASRGA